MDYRLLLLIIIALLLIIIMWYLSSDYHTNSIKVDISDDDPSLLKDWFKHELAIKDESFPEELDNKGKEVAVQLLAMLYDIDVESYNIVLGTNIDEQYCKITNKHLIPNKTIFNLRDILGLNLEIGIVNSRVQNKFNNHEHAQYHSQILLLIAIVDRKAHELLLPYIKKVLDHRWNKLRELQDERIINDYGSFVYIKSTDSEILPNTFGMLTDNKVRVNLLCSEYEFNLLLKRWRSYMKQDNTLVALFE